MPARSNSAMLGRGIGHHGQQRQSEAFKRSFRSHYQAVRIDAHAMSARIHCPLQRGTLISAMASPVHSPAALGPSPSQQVTRANVFFCFYSLDSWVARRTASLRRRHNFRFSEVSSAD